MTIIKKNGNKILDGNFTKELEVAEFNNSWNSKTKSNFVNEHNHGIEMLQAYEDLRSSNIEDIVQLMKKLEKIYGDFNQRRYEIKKQFQSNLDQE